MIIPSIDNEQKNELKVNILTSIAKSPTKVRYKSRTYLYSISRTQIAYATLLYELYKDIAILKIPRKNHKET